MECGDPHVFYNADPQSGFSTYSNKKWYVVGGKIAASAMGLIGIAGLLPPIIFIRTLISFIRIIFAKAMAILCTTGVFARKST